MKGLGVLVAAPILGCLAVPVLAGGSGPPSAVASPAAGGACMLVTAGASISLDGEQVHDAGVIDTVGRELRLPRYAEVIALATAWQESDLRDLPYGDRDSLGLFQQRPSQGWGSPEQILDPVYAATAFYQRLVTVPGWQQQPLTIDAQAVQRSAHPEAYARWQPAAAALEAALTGQPGSRLSCGGSPAAIPPTLPAPTNRAASAAIVFALTQLDKPYQIPPSPPASWDCSSLVQAAYAAAGIRLPRTTYQQVSGSGPAIPLDPADWQPGDLLFALGADPRGGLPGHVGLYLGSGYVLDAPHSGAVVTVTTLSGYGPVVAATRPWLLPAAGVRPPR